MYYLAFLVEIIHKVISPFYPFFPLLNRAEVLKVSITHYFNPKKPQTELGYFPIVTPEEGIKRTVEYWKKQKKPENNVMLFVIIIAIVILAFIVNKLLF